MNHPSLSRLRAWVIAAGVMGGLPATPAWAQRAELPGGPRVSSSSSTAPRPATVTLAAALDAAWQRAVAARESDAQRGRAVAERAAAGSLWAAAPALELSHRSDRWQGDAGQRETEISLAVPLWLPGQRAARSATADAAAAQAEASAAVARLHLAGELREVAWALVAYQAEATGTDLHLRVLRQLADDVERRVRAGDLARADSLAAQAELLVAVAQQAEARQRIHLVRARWTLLTGLPADLELRAEAVAAGADGVASPTHPEIQLASQSTAHARRRLELLRHSRRDAPELMIGMRRDVADRTQPSQGSVVVGLRLPFGTDARNKPLEATALGEVDVSQTTEQRVRDRVESDIATARAVLQSAQAQWHAESTRAALLRDRAALIDRSFRAGETALPDQLRALAAAAQADSASTRQQAALGLAHARLQQSLGLLP